MRDKNYWNDLLIASLLGISKRLFDFSKLSSMCVRRKWRHQRIYYAVFIIVPCPSALSVERESYEKIDMFYANLKTMTDELQLVVFWYEIKCPRIWKLGRLPDQFCWSAAKYRDVKVGRHLSVTDSGKECDWSRLILFNSPNSVTRLCHGTFRHSININSRFETRLVLLIFAVCAADSFLLLLMLKCFYDFICMNSQFSKLVCRGWWWFQNTSVF